MKIINLIENTEGNSGCKAEHGLCFYIETKKHKLLMDTGSSNLFISNAREKGVDLKAVDTVVLSHGHYDHAGGIIPFSEINSNAKIYIHPDAFTKCYSTTKGGEPRYIGIDPAIAKLKQLCIPEMFKAKDCEKNGIFKIDDELELFSNIGNSMPAPLTNKTLFAEKDGELMNDDFSHEQCLVIRQDGADYVFSGCAHHGVLNVLDRYKALYGEEPRAVFSGFHMLRKTGYSEDDIDYIRKTAEELCKTSTAFYTGHCTGVEPYEEMKKIMGDKITYVHCGDEVVI